MNTVAQIIHHITANYDGSKFCVVPRIACADGFSISVQAHSGSYCAPRIAGSDHYTEVECGFPSDTPDEIMDYAESPEDPTGTVYPYVPVERVAALIDAHGGIAVNDE